MNATTRELILRRRLRRNGRYHGDRSPLFFVAALPLVAVTLGVGGMGTSAAVYAYYAQRLPPPEAIQEIALESFQTTKIYDRTGTVLLWEIFDPRRGDRELVALERIPLHLRLATIATEDRHFYENPGVDPRGILRAALVTSSGVVCGVGVLDPLCRGLNEILPGGFEAGAIQGGSTITQQLVKNVAISPEERFERSPIRKIKEIILALEITRLYSKDQILEWYLNTVDYGTRAYGVEAAAQAYFGKSVSEVDLAESAMLAALPQAPGANNPLTNPQRARIAQSLVLEAMFRDGYITRQQMEQAKAEFEKLKFVQEEYNIVAAHFVDYVRQILEERYGPDVVLRGGLRVYTTVDLKLQALAEQACRRRLASLQELNRNVTNCAVVAINPRTGEILTMLGSPDFFDKEIDGQYNNALAPRQPGSSFKIFTYSQAFLEGHTPATMIMDVRTSFNDYPNPPYSPENYDRVFHGPLTLRQALARSVNLPAVKLLDMVGLQDVLAQAHRLGINTLNDDRYGLSLTLGGGEVTPLDMAYAYSLFANNGVMVGRPVDPQNLRPGYRELDPVAILRVEDAQGNVLEEYRVPEARQVLDPKVAYLITHILSDNDARAPAFGLNSPLRLSRPAAAKTGTSDDWRDSWTIGYVPQLATSVWLGNADNTPTDRVPGSLGAAFIWHDFMEAALKELQLTVEPFLEPPGLERVVVDATSGLLPSEYSPSTITELFLPGTAPTAPDNIHLAFDIFRPTGLLASAYCPLDQVERRVFEIYPPEAADWVRENNIPQPPNEYEPSCGPSPIHSDVAIINPRSNSYVRGIFNIDGNARGGDFQRYRILFGEGLNPSTWTQIGPDHYNQVSQGWLETWDASALNGLYTMQLEVIDHNGSLRTATTQIIVDNTPPEVEIDYPPEGSEFVVEDYEWVILQAAATDNFSLDRVEFYVDDQLIATDTVSPYNQKWPFPPNIGPGQHRIYMKAFDKAGNETKSGEVTFMLTKPTPTPSPSGGG